MERSSRQVPLDPSQVTAPSHTKDTVCPSVIRHENDIEHPNPVSDAADRVLSAQAEVKNSGGHEAIEAEILTVHDCQNIRPAEHKCQDTRKLNTDMAAVSSGADDERKEHNIETNAPNLWRTLQQHSLLPLQDLSSTDSTAFLQPQQTSHGTDSTTDPVLVPSITNTFLLPRPYLRKSPQETSPAQREWRSTERCDAHQQASTDSILFSQTRHDQPDKTTEARAQHDAVRQAEEERALKYAACVKSDDDEDLINLGTDGANHASGSTNEGQLQRKKSANARYACPFYKHDAQKYRSERSCVGPGWRSVHRVKEHVIRKHTSAEYECHRCHVQFKTEPQLKRHAQKPCQYRSRSPRCGRIDQSQIQQLKSRKGKAKTEEEKWYELYKICFPSVEKFPSPYFEAELEAPADGFRTQLFGEGSLGEELRKRLREKLSSYFEKMESSILTRIEDAVESALKDTLQHAQETECNFSRIKTCSYPPLSWESSIVSDERIYPSGLQNNSFESGFLSKLEPIPPDVDWAEGLLGMSWDFLDSAISYDEPAS